MRYFICAGEASGDLHGAALMEALRAHDSEAEFVFLGGDKMASVADHAPLIHIRAMAYMGFSEVLRNLDKVRANMKSAQSVLREADTRPDALILIDYPSFNLRLAKEAHLLGVPVFYFIPPKVWAWKEWRIKQLRKYCTEIYCILPFEVDFYTSKGVNVKYVGNPSQGEIDEIAPSLVPVVADLPILALVPGSRIGEIRNNLPVMLQAAERFKGRLTPVVGAAPGIDDSLYHTLAPDTPIYRDGTLELMNSACIALVTSGTATLECALLGTPQIACYRANGSRLSYSIMKHLLSVSRVTLPNLILADDAIPEMLLHNCNPDALAAEIEALMPGEPEREAQLRAYGHLRSVLGIHNAADEAATDITNRLRNCG